MSEELVPHVDQHNHLLGLVPRSVAYRDGLPHRSIHGLLRNSAGEFLLQQRSFSKQTWPGKWDLSLGETVRGNEEFEAALKRGLAEELGIEKPLYPTSIYAYRYHEYRYPPFKVHGVICLYMMKYDGAISLSDGEVAETAWKKPADITKLIISNPELCTPWLVNDWQYFLQWQSKL